MAVKYGKFLAGGLGWALFGPIGGLLGFLAGTIYDEKENFIPEPADAPGKEDPSTRPGDFTVSLLVLVAATMKADGRVTKKELDYVKQFFVQQFGVDKARESMLMLRDIVKQDIPVDQVCGQIRVHMDYHSRLQLLHTLYSIAAADNYLHPNEVYAIDRMARLMGIQESDLYSIRAMFEEEDFTDYGHYERQRARTRDISTAKLSKAYQIMGVDPSATDEEIKRAYRQMAVKYHPDKVAHLGEDHQKVATQKFQKVQEAYETIRQARGL
jgi:DnaJ like chaperone protein